MSAALLSRQVGPWPMNTYVVICKHSGRSAIIDPGAEPDTILAMAQDTTVEKILLTHAHPDHVGALESVKTATGAPVFLHPLGREEFGIEFDQPLSDGEILSVGDIELRAVHTPGHTPGMISLLIDHRVLVGDTLFVGGPGRTWSSDDFATTMRTLQEIVFKWPDETEFYPGHGPQGTIGQERPAFEAFVARGWPDDLHGDVTWSDV